jgi:hypothetical protein
MLDDGPIAQELLSYSQKAIANLPFRLQLGRALLQAARDPRRAMIVLEQIADRLEGKPVQKLRHDIPHATYSYEAGKPKPPEVEEAERRKAAEHGVRPAPASSLEVLAPPPPPPAERGVVRVEWPMSNANRGRGAGSVVLRDAGVRHSTRPLPRPASPPGPSDVAAK